MTIGIIKKERWHSEVQLTMGIQNINVELGSHVEKNLRRYVVVSSSNLCYTGTEIKF